MLTAELYTSAITRVRAGGGRRGGREGTELRAELPRPPPGPRGLHGHVHGPEPPCPPAAPPGAAPRLGLPGRPRAWPRTGPTRFALEVFKLARSLSKDLPAGPRLASRPSPQHPRGEGAGRLRGAPRAPPARKPRSPEARPRRSRPRAESRAAQPGLPVAARPGPRTEGSEGCAATAAFRRGPRLPVPDPQSKYLSWPPEAAELGRGWGPRPSRGPAWASPRRSPSPERPRPHRLLTGNADKLNTAGITAICSGYRCRY